MESITDDVFDVIARNPGIDAPLVCLRLNDADCVDPAVRGTDLAKWLSEWHRDAWNRTCAAVDELLEEGMISFSDDGELRATGY